MDESPETPHSQPIPPSNPAPVQHQGPTEQQPMQQHPVQQPQVQQPQIQQVPTQEYRPPYSRMQTPPRKPTPQQTAQIQELPSVTPLQVQYNKDVPPIPRSNSTSGGRPIPPRSELRSPGPPAAAVELVFVEVFAFDYKVDGIPV